jgi:hypothetical protein
MTDEEYKLKSLPKIPDTPKEALLLAKLIIEQEEKELMR